MSHNASNEKRRHAVMRMPIEDLAGWHMLVHCPACRQDRNITLDSLIERFGGEATLARLVPRLRCQAVGCRREPDSVKLRNRFPVHPGPALVEVVLKGLERFRLTNALAEAH